MAKSEHHLSVLSDFKHSNRIFKAFKSRSKPLVQNTTLEFTIKWEQAIDNLGRMPVSTLVDHRPLQAQENQEKLSDLQLIINEILQEIQLIYSSTDIFIILCKKHTTRGWHRSHTVDFPQKEKQENSYRSAHQTIFYLYILHLS